MSYSGLACLITELATALTGNHLWPQLGRLELATMMAVETALSQPYFCPQRLLEDLSLQTANVPIFLGQFLIGTIILSQNRQRFAASCATGSYAAGPIATGSAIAPDFDIISPASQRISQSLHPLVQAAVGKSTDPRDKCISDSLGDGVTSSWVCNSADFTPQNECQVAVIIAKLPQPFFGDPIDVMGPPATAANQVSRNKFLILQTEQTLTHSGSRHADRGADVLNGLGADAVQFVEEFPIRMLKNHLHGTPNLWATTGSSYFRHLS